MVKITSKANARNRNSRRISNREDKITYGAVEVEPLVVSAMLLKRLLMSGKISSLGKVVVISSEASALPVKLNASLPERFLEAGSEGLLSLFKLHSERWDGEDLDGDAMF